MKIVDVSDNPRINRLVQMVSAISLAQTPRDMLMAFAEHYWHLRPSDYIGGSYREHGHAIQLRLDRPRWVHSQHRLHYGLSGRHLQCYGHRRQPLHG